jgi:hypothetical protein
MLAIRFAARREFGVGEDLGEKEIRAVMAVEQVGVPAEPSDTRGGRPFALEYRARVDVCARDGVGALAFEPRRHRAGAREHRVMVVRSQRIRGNPAAHRGAPIDIGDCGRGVGIAEAYDGAQTRIDPPRVKPPLGVASEPSHLARPSLIEPLIEKLRAIIEAAKRCEADQEEALLVRGRRENFFQSDH